MLFGFGQLLDVLLLEEVFVQDFFAFTETVHLVKQDINGIALRGRRGGSIDIDSLLVK